MAWVALGDAAWLYETGRDGPASPSDRVRALQRQLERTMIREATDLVVSFDSMAVHFQPENGETVLDWLNAQPLPRMDDAPDDAGNVVEIPVVYGGGHGPDLESVATALGRSAAEVVRLHQAANYTVAAVGFSPGFPYLAGLPEELRLPRLKTPRKVAAGSVAIAGEQAGIYPSTSQGGWHVLGRTAVPLFDPMRSQPSLLRPGDRVRFVPVERLEEPPASSVPREVVTGGDIEVLMPGAFTTVQDRGRPGYQNIGVSPGGAADPLAAQVANLLVGNPEHAAVLDCSMQGPLLRFRKKTRVAFVGWADGRSGVPLVFKSGAELDLRTRMRAVRGYLAAAGGINVPLVLGSRATDVRAGFGGLHGRSLKSGDVLPTGVALHGPPAGAWRIGWPYDAEEQPIALRFLPGIQAQWFAEASRERFQTSIYQISRASDRTGARLDGPRLECDRSGTMVSQPVVAGSVQVPPDGQPIVLLAEHQTIGGYPQIGHVISADLPKLARAWPGAMVSFREVTLDEARAAWRELRRKTALLQTGLDFLR
jgi:KipI family sensor histidine kinase inhibitor